jgi:hypothetical protein
MLFVWFYIQVHTYNYIYMHVCTVYAAVVSCKCSSLFKQYWDYIKLAMHPSYKYRWLQSNVYRQWYQHHSTSFNIIQHNSTSFNIIVYWNIIENTGGRIVINPWIYSCLFRLFFLASHFSCSWHGCNSNDNLQEMNAVSEGNKPFVRQSKWLKHTMWAFQV